MVGWGGWTAAVGIEMAMVHLVVKQEIDGGGVCRKKYGIFSMISTIFCVLVFLQQSQPVCDTKDRGCGSDVKRR